MVSKNDYNNYKTSFRCLTHIFIQKDKVNLLENIELVENRALYCEQHRQGEHLYIKFCLA